MKYDFKMSTSPCKLCTHNNEYHLLFDPNIGLNTASCNDRGFYYRYLKQYSVYKVHRPKNITLEDVSRQNDTKQKKSITELTNSYYKC